MKIIVPISGGKDSQACLILAIQEVGVENVLGLFCDTQWEHPLTYKHIENLKLWYGVTIATICAGDVLSKVVKYGRFPSFAARFCTDELKTAPTKYFLKSWGKPVEVWYGMRTKESGARAKRYENKVSHDVYMPHEVMPSKYPKYLGKMGIRFKLPVLDWTSEQINDFVGHERLNPLYAQGADRVGCYPCLAMSDGPKQKVFERDSYGKFQRERVRYIELKIEKSVYEKENKGGNCQVCSI